jgi:hypothetical protein
MDDVDHGSFQARLAAHLALLLYGAIVAAAALSISTAHADRVAWVVVAILGSLLVYWLSHVYVHVLAERVGSPELGTAGQVRRTLRHQFALVVGGLPTAVMFVLPAGLGADLGTAAFIALWCTVALLAAVGYAAGRSAGASGWRLAVQAGVGALFGVAAIALKLLLH